MNMMMMKVMVKDVSDDDDDDNDISIILYIYIKEWAAVVGAASLLVLIYDVSMMSFNDVWF